MLVLPHELLGAQPPGAADAQGGSTATSWGTGSGAAMPPLEPVRTPPPPRRPEPADTGPTVPAWAEPVPGARPRARPLAEPVPYAVSDAGPGPGSDGDRAFDAARPDTAAEPALDAAAHAAADVHAVAAAHPVAGPGFAGAGGPVPAALTVPAARVDPDRPTLPRRRAQEHLVPELREAPAPRRAPEAEPPVHDPGLMAAFRRGFDRAGSEPPA
ncbi:hypothetical protein ACFSNO_02525 [Streptomyces cirratus]